MNGKFVLEDGNCLNAVSMYKHLGVVYTDSGTLQPEVMKRVSSGKAAITDLRKSCLQDSRIPLKNRLEVVKCIIVEKLLRNAGTWHQMPAKGGMLALNAAYMHALRIVASMPRSQGGVHRSPGSHCAFDALAVIAHREGQASFCGQTGQVGLPARAGLAADTSGPRVAVAARGGTSRRGR